MKNNKRKFKFGFGIFFKTIFFTIAFVLLIIAGSILYKANTNPHSVPDVFGYKPMIVLSGSMETSIYEGDLVFVKEVDTDILKKDDVIAFWNEENTITTHRIVEIVNENNRTYFKTKGDNNNSEDANLVPVEDVEGIYVSRIPNVGNYLMFIQEPIGLAVILLITLLPNLLVVA